MAEEEITCECLDSACKPCEVETGTSFYSAKCGSKVKSCKKPSCAPVENQRQCLTQLGLPVPESANPVKTTEPIKRVPASASEVSTEPVGKVVVVVGTADVTHHGGKSESVRENMDVFEKDPFETRESSKLKIVFNEGNDMVVLPKTKTVIETSQFAEGSEKGKTLINLLYGKLRNKVRRNYDNKNAYFRVKTPTAVAGVRGTDFVISYDGTAEASNKITRVDTFDGKVGLSAATALASGREPSATQEEREIASGHYGIHTTSLDASGNPRPGLLGPAEKIDAEALRKLNEETDLKAVARAASDSADDGKNEHVVCTSPNAGYRQCSFQCVGGPAGANKCRTDLPGVRCVRKVCNANGKWAEDSRMPASQGDLCEASGVHVRECGIAW